jgi:hypothetical protein
MLDGIATGFDKEASHTTLEHRVVSAEANAQFLQHSLKRASIIMCVACTSRAWAEAACMHQNRPKFALPFFSQHLFVRGSGS